MSANKKLQRIELNYYTYIIIIVIIITYIMIYWILFVNKMYISYIILIRSNNNIMRFQKQYIIFFKPEPGMKWYLK
jgi:hypothetical protein